MLSIRKFYEIFPHCIQSSLNSLSVTRICISSCQLKAESALIKIVLDWLFELSRGQHVDGGVGDAVQELQEDNVVANLLIEPRDRSTYTDHGDYPQGHVGQHDGDEDQADGFRGFLVSHKRFVLADEESKILVEK